MAVDVYNKNAGVYDAIMRLWGYTPAVKAVVKTLARQLPEDAKVLDLGCGTGLSMHALVERFDEDDVMGLDLSEEMLEICKQKYPNTTLVKADFNNGAEYCTYPDGHTVKLEDDSFDLVVSAGSVSEYGNWDVVVPLVYGLVKKGGLYVNLGLKKNLVNRLSGKLWNFTPKAKEDFKTACVRAGFRKIGDIEIPWKYFPSNVLKYAIKAEK